jgi:hypothetical protein
VDLAHAGLRSQVREPLSSLSALRDNATTRSVDNNRLRDGIDSLPGERLRYPSVGGLESSRVALQSLVQLSHVGSQVTYVYESMVVNLGSMTAPCSISDCHVLYRNLYSSGESKGAR